MVLRQRLWGLLLVVVLLLGYAGWARAKPAGQAGGVNPVLIAARSDLESLANQAMGDGVRPVGWTNDYDPAGASFVVNMRLDLELLAGARLGADQRPSGWFGAVSGSPEEIARDIRHDLELLADALLGPGQRPPIWIGGGNPLLACDRTLQAAVPWLQRTNPVFKLSPFLPGPDYCAQASEEVNLFIEILVPGETPTGEPRTDINTLYRAILGTDVFPAGWTNTPETNGLRHDLDQLRGIGAQVGQAVTDSAWFGAVFGTDWVVGRALRHDLEVLADAKLGYNTRPDGWTYVAPSPEAGALLRCPRGTQNLARLLQKDAGFTYTADVYDAGYCTWVDIQAGRFVTANLPSETGGGEESAAAAAPAVAAPAVSGGAATTEGGLTSAAASVAPMVVAIGGIDGQAVSPTAYLDRQARQAIGVILRGTALRALARSSAEGSRMMYVTGEGFHVWVGWPWTTLTEEQYLSLPLAESVQDQLPQLLCFATFCEAIIHNGDPMGRTLPNGGAAGGSTSAGSPGRNLQYLDYAHTRVYFDVDNQGENWAEIRIDVCGQIGNVGTCEPILRLIENGQVVRPLRVVNGYPVWRMAYNLHSTARLESRHYYVNQLWVTHPNDR